jgi:hypothetical protein
VNIASTAAIDPELYLRMHGESQLITRIPGFAGLGPIGSALVAVGLLEPDVAAGVVADYTVAAELRNHGFGLWPREQVPEEKPTAAPLAPVVQLCRRGDDGPDDTWPYAVLGPSSTEIATVYSGPANWDVVATRFPKPQGFPQSLQLEDDTGRVVNAMLQGGSDGRFTWIGRFASDSPLSQQTQWLELGGVRVDLEPAMPAPNVKVESHPPASPTSRAADFLRHRVASTDVMQHQLLRDDPIVVALIETGALAEPDTLLAELEAMANVLRFGPHASGSHGVGHMLVATAPSMLILHASGTVDGPLEPDPLPPEWASLKRPVTWSGPEAVVPLGVATPVLEGTAAVLIALTSEADRFRIDTIESGGPRDPRFEMQHVDPRPAFAWWAQDDCGGWYLGQWQLAQVDDKGKRGDVTYYPAIDPRARTLTLYPTLRRDRAVIEVALPWQPTE